MPISKKAKELGPDHIYRHPTLFSKEDLDAILIPEEERLTVSEYKKKKLHEKLTYRHPLPEEANIYENSPLTKENLINYANKQNITIATNTPSMAITALAQYANKPETEVTQADAITLHLSTDTQFPEGMNNHNLLLKFRKANNIDRYGLSQHQLIKSYSNHLLENVKL
ncbi:MAG: hypothetical protein ACLFTH_01380 [Candidatus Woesearchaeota archaeon]